MKKVLFFLTLLICGVSYSQKRAYHNERDTVYSDANGFLQRVITLFRKDSSYIGNSGREITKRTIYLSTETLGTLPPALLNLTNTEYKELFAGGITTSDFRPNMDIWYIKVYRDIYVYDPSIRRVVLTEEPLSSKVTFFVNGIVVMLIGIAITLFLILFKKSKNPDRVI